MYWNQLIHTLFVAIAMMLLFSEAQAAVSCVDLAEYEIACAYSQKQATAIFSQEESDIEHKNKNSYFSLFKQPIMTQVSTAETDPLPASCSNKFQIFCVYRE